MNIIFKMAILILTELNATVSNGNQTPVLEIKRMDLDCLIQFWENKIAGAEKSKAGIKKQTKSVHQLNQLISPESFNKYTYETVTSIKQVPLSSFEQRYSNNSRSSFFNSSSFERSESLRCDMDLITGKTRDCNAPNLKLDLFHNTMEKRMAPPISSLDDINPNLSPSQDVNLIATNDNNTGSEYEDAVFAN